MVKVLQDVWVMTEGGEIVFERIFNDKLNTDMFAGLVSALNIFAAQIEEGYASEFEIKSRKFIMKKKEGLIFVSNYSKNVKPKSAKAEIKNISVEFFEVYTPEDLMLFNGDKSIFEKKAEQFTKNIGKSLDMLNDFWKGMN